MESRRNFFKKAAFAAGAAAMPISSAWADEQVKSKAATTGNTSFKNTYIKNLFVTENQYRMGKGSIVKSPGFEKAKSILPSPIWKNHDEQIGMYWKAWEMAFNNIKDPSEGSGFISSYIDTAYNGNIFMWDSSFITMFARYGSRAYPFQNTLDNFYAKQHPDGFICREIWGDSGEDAFERFDPTSTGPNLLPWSEMVFFQHFGDMDRIQKVFPALAGYYQWWMLNRTWKDGSYWTSGWGSGMDNQPRLEPEYNPIFSNGHMTWIDACLQQLFVGKILVQMGFYIERWQEIEDIEDSLKALKKFIREQLWDSESAFLYDQYKDGSLGTTKGIGAFWALWTEVLEPDELDAFVNHLKNKDTFNRLHPIPSIPANHEKYQADGRYWQGGVWAPTNYMIIRGLQDKGYTDLAYDLASRHYDQVFQVYQKTGTFWEYYAPEATEPGMLARPDFVGWTGLVPIAVLFESVFGLLPNAMDRELIWEVSLTDEHGVDRYPFGSDGLLKLHCDSRSSTSARPSITIESNTSFKLKVKWGNKQEETLAVTSGTNRF